VNVKEPERLSEQESTSELNGYAQADRDLAGVTAEERIAWAVKTFGDRLIATSSFGIQSAVTLHMVTRQVPDIPIVTIDTGYLFPETYRFIDELKERLQLNLHIYRSGLSPAWQEARWGKLWEMGLEGIQRYNRINKVEPMERAIAELQPAAWISGLRRHQSQSRQHLGVLARQDKIIKVHPVIDWSNKQIHEYLKAYDLPYHPLWEKGYLSVGDVHTTRKWEEGMSEEETRFFGLKRECGLHEPASNFSI